jgi:hypothetical protein
MVFLHIQDNIDNYNNKIKNNQRILFCLCFTYRFYFNGGIQKNRSYDAIAIDILGQLDTFSFGNYI